MKASLILLYVLISLTKPQLATAAVACSAEKPDGCVVYGFNVNKTHVLRTLENTFVNVTGNLTVYAGQTATFIFEVDRSTLSDVSPVAYVDDCKDNSNCELIDDNVKKKRTRKCVFQDVDQSDDGKEIQFYVLSFLLFGTQLCHNPPSYLHVIGPPMPVNVSYSVDPCTGIHLEITSPVDPDTSVLYSVHSAKQFLSLYQSNFTTSGTTTTAVISSDILQDHSGVYIIITTPMNMAGNGASTNTTISLPTDNYLISFKVENVTVEVNNSNQFNALVKIKVNTMCQLSVPNHLFVSSSCSNDGEVEYPVNMTHLLTASHNNQVQIYHPLQSERHNCTATVRDQTGGTLTVDTRKSTFHTASYQLYTNSPCVYAQCTFIPGSMAEGCMIVVYNEQGDIADNMLYLQSSSRDYIQLGPFHPGQYSLYAFDYINGMEFNLSTAIPLSQKSFTIPANSRNTCTSISSISRSSSTNPSTTTPSMSSTINPSTTPPCFSNECHKSPVHTSSIYIYIGTSVFVILLMLIAIVIILVLLIMRRKMYVQEYAPAHLGNGELNDESKQPKGSDEREVTRDQAETKDQLLNISEVQQLFDEKVTPLPVEQNGEGYIRSVPPANEPVVDDEKNEDTIQPMESKGPYEICATEEEETSSSNKLETKIMLEAMEPAYVNRWSTAELETSEAQGGTHLPIKLGDLPSVIPGSTEYYTQKRDECVQSNQETSFSVTCSDQPLLMADDDHKQHVTFAITDEEPQLHTPLPEQTSASDKALTHRRASLVSTGVLVLPSYSDAPAHEVFLGLRNESITTLKDMEGQLSSAPQRNESTTTLKDTNYGGGDLLVKPNQVLQQHAKLHTQHNDGEYMEESVLESAHKVTTPCTAGNSTGSYVMQPSTSSTKVRADTTTQSAESIPSETAMLLKKL